MVPFITASLFVSRMTAADVIYFNIVSRIRLLHCAQLLAHASHPLTAMVVPSGASSGPLQFQTNVSSEARPGPICITIQVGIAGSRNLHLMVGQHDVLLDIAKRVQQSFSPEYDKNDIMLVHGINRLGLISTVADIGLHHGSVLQAVITSQHPISVHNSCMDIYPCDCKRFWCRCFGRNFVFNLDTFAPLLALGKTTIIKNFFEAMQINTWSTDCNHGNMSANELSHLCQAAAGEVLWNCNRCRKLAICRCVDCIPLDDNQHHWRVCLSGLTFCGTCVAIRPGIQSEVDPFVRVPPRH